MHNIGLGYYNRLLGEKGFSHVLKSVQSELDTGGWRFQQKWEFQEAREGSSYSLSSSA